KLLADALYIGSSVGEAMVTAYGMKYLSERERPFNRYPDKINALAKGEYIPQNLSDSDDTRVMIEALNGETEVIDIKAAGTAMRFLTAYLSVTPPYFRQNKNRRTVVREND
ncbi:hypothetical protein EZS27_043657, partial [termite gut metagenome]